MISSGASVKTKVIKIEHTKRMSIGKKSDCVALRELKSSFLCVNLTIVGWKCDRGRG